MPIHDPYAVLGVSSQAEDAEIRRVYLTLTIRYQPEQFPVESARIREAYEMINTVEKRARYQLFELGQKDSFDSFRETLEASLPRTRSGLAELLNTLTKAARS